jgi:uncharacterized membrane protein YfcA
MTWFSYDIPNGTSWYYIYRATVPLASVVGLTPIARVTATSFIDTITTNGTWYYAIVAGNAYYNSTVSNCVPIVVAIPPAPSTAGLIPESVFYAVVGAMTGVAILALVVGLLAGRRSNKQSAKRSTRADLPTPASSTKKP